MSTYPLTLHSTKFLRARSECLTAKFHYLNTYGGGGGAETWLSTENLFNVPKLLLSEEKGVIYTRTRIGNSLLPEL